MKKLLLIIGILFVSTNVFAEDTLEIKPGLWEFTMLMESAMMGNKTANYEECIKDETINPSEMFNEMPGDQCKTTSTVSGNSVQFTSQCQQDGINQNTEGTFTSNGDSVEGNMVMTSNIQGMELNVNMKMQGKRLKDC